LSSGELYLFVLDFDGVITTLDIDWKLLKENISKSLNLDIPSFASFFEHKYRSHDFERVSEIVKRKELEAIKVAEPYSDVLPALKLLEKKESRTYIASMQSIDVLEDFLRRFELFHFFKAVLGRENGGSKKAQLAEIKDLEQNESERKGIVNRLYPVLIDDVRRNVIAGRGLGYDSILFRRLGNNTPSLVDIVKTLIERQ
jgi:phosphoglycolate phosphatase-like HAD superfamily hydrolase